MAFAADRPRRSAIIGALSLAAILLLGGCATEPGSPPSAPPTIPPLPGAPGPVMAEGLILQQEGREAMICLGMVAESWPPHCSGPAILDWDWATAPEPKYEQVGVRWGDYAVSGRWDGTSFTITEPPQPLGSLTPAPSEPDPRRDPANAGPGEPAELERIQRELHEEPWGDAVGLLYAFPDNGYLWVTVLYDDMTIRNALEDHYGSGTIIVVSAIRDT